MQAAYADELLDAEGLAPRLGLKPETVMRWYREGRIPGLKITNKVLRFRWAAVLAALESQQGSAR